MGVMGSMGPGGGAPIPDAERVAAIRFTILDDAETCAGFAEGPATALNELNTHIDAALRSNGFAECRSLLAQLDGHLNVLDLARLEPRRGLAGLFDSRAKRLKVFRAAYRSAVPRAGETADEITQRGAAIAGQGHAVDALWTQTRDAIVDLDAHVVAARAWLADRGDPAAGTFVDPLISADTLPTDTGSSTHPLDTRLTELTAVRSGAIASLSVLRAFQNAEHRLPAALTSLPDAVEAWRLEWRDALGLAGKKPRKLRPDAQRLNDARAVVTGAIAAADRQVSHTFARWSELERRRGINPAASNGSADASPPTQARLDT